MYFIIVLVVLGLVVGFIGGYAGIGGAPFMIAFLVLFCAIPQLTAQGSILTMMLGPMSLLGLLVMKNEVRAQLRNITIGVISYAVFSYFGALIAFHYGEVSIKIWFAILLYFVAIFQFLSKNINYQVEEKHKQIPLFGMIVTSVITGIIGGVFGIGAGVLMLPVFIIIFKQDKNYARALSLAILLPPVSIGAYVKYNMENAIDWNIVLILFISYFASNYFGAKMGINSSDKLFKRIYAVVLVAIATIYFFM
jgi:uncharacterized membrane protein YfcA